MCDHTTNTVVYIARNILIHAVIRSTKNKITRDLSLMTMYYTAWISRLSTDEIWTRFQFVLAKYVLARCHVLGTPTHI